MRTKRGREQEVLDIFAKWDLDAAVIGQVTDNGRVVIRDNGTIVAMNGRYGPYIRKDFIDENGAAKSDTRSLETEEQIFDVSLEQALRILAEPKRRRGQGAASAPLRELGVDPATLDNMIAYWVRKGRIREVRQNVQEYVLADGRRIHVVAEGRLVNLGAAEGHPAAVMDMSFANQALSAEYLIKNRPSMEKKVYAVPEAIDREIARLKLESMKVRIDVLTEEQVRYLNSWEEGT